MADAPNLDSVVDDLSKPENQAKLNEALNDAFKEATTTADDKTAEPTGENKDVKTEEEVPVTDDPSKQKAGESEQKTSRIDEILADRNAAKAEAANAQTEVQALTKQVETLTSLVEKLTTGKEQDGAGRDSGTDEQTGKSLDEIVAAKVAEALKEKDASSAAEKSITEAIQALDTNKETPNASQYSKEIRRVMETFPNMKADVAYAVLVGKGIIPKETLSSNANRTGTGTRSKTTLLSEKKPEDMSTAEMFQYLKGAEKSGDLKI